MVGSERAAYLFLSLLQARVGGSFVSRLDGGATVGLVAHDAGGVRRRDSRRRTKPGMPSMRCEEASTSRQCSAAWRNVAPRCSRRQMGRIRRRSGEVPDPPPALYVEGGLSAGPSVAVVGSRKATATGLEAARALGRALGARGVCVVSGLALGVDAAAHEGALEVGGSTVGVLGCGINVVYPSANRTALRGGAAARARSSPSTFSTRPRCRGGSRPETGSSRACATRWS